MAQIKDDDSVICNICETTPLDDLTIENLFEKCDSDHNGYINRDEFKGFVDILRTSHKISERKLQRLYSRADTNHDNKIDRDEFRAMIKDPLIQRCLKGYCDMFIPASQRQEEYKCMFCPPPIGLLSISFVQLVLFIIDAPYDPNDTNSLCYNLSLDSNKNSQVWRYVTYMFVHDGWSHLVGNLLLQIILGTGLEIYHSSWRICLIYFSGGFAGALATRLIQPDVKLVGASGGVYAILASYIATTFLNYSEMSRPLLQLIIFSVWIVIDYSQAIYNMLHNSMYTTGYIAHIFGGISGLISGTFLLRNFKVKGYEILLQKLAIILYSIFICAMMALNTYHND